MMMKEHITIKIYPSIEINKPDRLSLEKNTICLISIFYPLVSYFYFYLNMVKVKCFKSRSSFRHQRLLTDNINA
jgi:hypothetical protein